MSVSEDDLTYQRELIWKNMVKLFIEKNMTDEIMLRRQRRFINQTSVRGKNKYKTLVILNTFLKTKDKDMAEQVFWNTVKGKVGESI